MEFLLRANPAVLMTSYHTDLVEEEKDRRPVGQLYVQMCIVRGR